MQKVTSGSPASILVSILDGVGGGNTGQGVTYSQAEDPRTSPLRDQFPESTIEYLRHGNPKLLLLIQQCLQPKPPTQSSRQPLGYRGAKASALNFRHHRLVK